MWGDALEQGIGPLRLLFRKAESLHQSNNYIKTFLSVPVSNICISRAQCRDPGCGVQCFACKLIRFTEEPVLCSSVSGSCPPDSTNLPFPCPFHTCASGSILPPSFWVCTFLRPTHQFKIGYKVIHSAKHFQHMDTFILNRRFGQILSFLLPHHFHPSELQSLIDPPGGGGWKGSFTQFAADTQINP